jgi:hypothetical protein
MAGPLKIPYIPQFAPASTPLHNLLGILRQQHGDCLSLAKGLPIFLGSHAAAR